MAQDIKKNWDDPWVAFIIYFLKQKYLLYLKKAEGRKHATGFRQVQWALQIYVQDSGRVSVTLHSA
jgi:hypothetical protein